MKKARITLVSICLLVILVLSPTIAGITSSDITSTTSVEAPGVALAASKSNLVANLSFGEGSGGYANDSSGNNNNGTLTNFDLSGCWVNGVVGTGLKFDGVNDYVNVEDSPDFGPMENLTVSVWVYPTKNMPTGSIISKRNCFIIHPGNGDNKITFYIYDGTWRGLGFATPIELNKWTHITGVYGSYDNEFKLYFNGVEVATDSTNYGSIVDDGGVLTIGRDDGYSRYFPGFMDEVLIYNTTLNATQIGNYYNDTLKNNVIINTTALPRGKVNSYYETHLDGWGGTGSYTWSIASGTLPTGITLATDGNLSGTPTQSGYFPVGIKLTDSQNRNKTGVLGIPIQKNWSLQMELQMDDGVGSTAADDSGLGLDGTLTNLNLTTCWVDGINGTSLEFDGVDDYLVIPDSDGLDNQDNITVSAWVYPTGESGYFSIVSKRNAFILTTSEVDNSAAFYIYSGAWRSTGWSVPLDYDQWTHLTGVYSNPDNVLKLYINGVEAKSDPTNYGAIGVDNDILTIGRDDGGNDYFTGRIDEVLIYNSTMTGTEIGDYYNSTWKEYLKTHVFLNNTLPPHAEVSKSYDFGLTAVGAAGTYTWNLEEGELPPGLTLTASGNITGTPTEKGVWEFTIKVSDIGGTTSTRPWSIIVVGDNASIVGEWDFNDPVFNPGLDLSGYWNNGTLTNFDQSNEITNGKLETGIRFDGYDDYIRIPHSTSVDLHQNITVEMWAKSGYIDIDIDLEEVPETSIPISNITELQWIGTNSAFPLDGDYHLANDISAGETYGWNNGQGFIPIGTSSDPFTGTFDGRGHSIDRLHIDRSSSSYQGIFGYVVGAIIKDIEINVIRISGNDYTGGLAGRMDTSTIYDITLTHPVISGDDYVGGLCGRISSSTVTRIDLNNVDITASRFGGGLAGHTDSGGITNTEVSGKISVGSEATGGMIGRSEHTTIHSTHSSVTVSGSGVCGGLIGHAYHCILEDSYTNGKVTGTSTLIGGLIGITEGSDISNCYATGSVTGWHNTGGLIGYQYQGRDINTYATGAVTSSGDYVGGLIGRLDHGTVINSYATGTVDGGSSNIGGLMGYSNLATISHCYATGYVYGDSWLAGLIGNVFLSDIYYSYATGNVYGQIQSSYYGGFAGLVQTSTISNCYNFNSVYGYHYMGGLVGRVITSTITNCYSRGHTSPITSGYTNRGGMVGAQFGSSATNSYYWNNWMSTSALGTARSSAQLQTQSNYVSWDFEFYWSMGGPSNWAKLQRPWYSLIKKGTTAYSMHLNTATSTLKAGIGVEYLNVTVSTPAKWHHYAMTYNGTNITAYQDGVEKGTLNVGAQTITNGEDITFGGGGYFLIGALDEIRMINNTLNGTEIKERYDWAFKPPVIVTTDVTTAYEDIPYFVDYEYMDLNNDDVTWVLSTNAPFLALDPATGILVGNQTQADIGSYWVNISCYDPVLSSTAHNFTLEVLNTNDAPTIDTTNIITTLEDELYSIDYEATDVDPGPDTLTWDLVTNATWLSINTTSGVLEGTPANEDVGFYSLDLWVNDGTVNVSTNFTLEVVNVNDDPIIDTVNPLTMKEEAFFSLDYDGYDVDPTDDVLTWNMTTNSSWLDMTGDLLFGQAPLDESGTSYWVNVTLEDDKGGLAWTNFTLTVVDVNDPPVITTSPVLNATEDTPYSLSLTAMDPDAGDMLTWTLVSGSDWMELNGNRLEGTPRNKDVGTNHVFLEVKDPANATDHLSFSINVANTNDEPVWILVPEDQNITENDTIQIWALANDPDVGDIISYSISSSPVVANLAIDAASGRIAWPGAEKGTYEINLVATDGTVDIYSDFIIIVKALPDVTPPDDNNTKPDDNQTDPDNNQTVSEPGPNSTTDTDQDGIPDWWEEFYGLDPNDPSDAGDDPDSDGTTNLEEYTARTSPTKDDWVPDDGTDGGSTDGGDGNGTDGGDGGDGDGATTSDSMGYIATIVILVILLIAAIAGAVFFMMKRKEEEMEEEPEEEEDRLEDDDEEFPDDDEDPDEDIDPDDEVDEEEDLDDELDLEEDGPEEEGLDDLDEADHGEEEDEAEVEDEK